MGDVVSIGSSETTRPINTHSHNSLYLQVPQMMLELKNKSRSLSHLSNGVWLALRGCSE
jgi:hypothetical protein